MTAVFVGSFDPFTIGHDNIARRALRFVDRLIIGVGVNERKTYMFTAEERVARIERLYRNESRVTVKRYTDLTADFARRERADVIVKGVRGADDFLYEQTQAEYNRRHAGIDTVLLIAETPLARVSSSRVRSLLAAGEDISSFLPDKC